MLRRSMHAARDVRTFAPHAAETRGASTAAPSVVRSSPATPPAASDLAALVAAEAELDRRIAVARAKAAAVLATAEAGAAEQRGRIAAELARARDRIASERAATAAAEREAIATTARAQIARFAAVRDEVAAELARVLADRLVDLALAEAAP